MILINNLVPKELSQSTIRHLQWIAQKDVLGQDVFLIGPPGPLRRIIAMQYLVSVALGLICFDKFNVSIIFRLDLMINRN